MTNDTTPRLGSTTPLPRIISVEDHVVEGYLAASQIPRPRA
jgi:hypothetical protein